MKRELISNLTKPISFLFHPEKDGRVIAMRNEFEKHGDRLGFKVSIDKEGWVAECKEIKGIITGGTNPYPSQKEIDEQITDAIHTAFAIPPHLSNIKLIRNAKEQPQQSRVLNLGYGLANQQ